MPNARTPAYTGKHRRQTRGRTVSHLSAAAAAGALLAAGAFAGVAEAATTSDFARLRICESGGNYGINTGNGYYGAYQFDLQTWHGLGLAGRPDQASRATQDAAARTLQAQRGWAPWPVCSRNLGLRGSAATASRSLRRAPLSGFHANLTFRPVKAPAFPGVRFTTALVGSVRPDVRKWQAQMARRGWVITVDGRYGPKSAAVARSFERQQHINGAGVVGVVAWRLAWEAPTS
jgi:peptidoglycan hydrolase-like protein with peptidoglycan-binding domain